MKFFERQRQIEPLTEFWVESRCGAVAASRSVFQIPLIEPDVQTRITAKPIKNVYQFLPDRWAPTN